MGQCGIPWLSYHPGASSLRAGGPPLPELGGGNSWGGRRGQPSSSSTRVLRAPCHCAMGLGAQWIYSALHLSLGAPSTLVCLRASSQGPQPAPLASLSPAAQSLQSLSSLSSPRPLRGTGVTGRLPCGNERLSITPQLQEPPTPGGRGAAAPSPLCSSPALAFLCAMAGPRCWARQAELAPLAGSPPRPRPVRAR